MSFTIDYGNLKPNSRFQNLYHVNAGRGSGLTAGLRKYNLYFTGQYIKLHDLSKRAAATALKIVKFVLDLFIFPVLGTLALLGVAINALHVKRNNQSFHTTLKKALQCSIKVTRTSASFKGSIDIRSSCTPEDLNKAIKETTHEGRFIRRVRVYETFVYMPRLDVSIATHTTPNQDQLKEILKRVNSRPKHNIQSPEAEWRMYLNFSNV